MKIKKALAFVLAMALCVAMPATVFAEDEPSEANRLTVSVSQQDVPVAPIGMGGVSITLDSSVPDSMVDSLVDGAISSLLSTLSSEEASAENVQVSIHIRKATESDLAELEQLKAKSVNNEHAAVLSDCINGHHEVTWINDLHRKISGTRCEHIRRYETKCVDCGITIRWTDFPMNSHIPGEMPGCPYKPDMRKLVS